LTAWSLQAVLRKLADAAPAAGDGELLRRFLAGDHDAFAELVRRHGRLVWGVCRHLTGSDAEADDAFQATFLVLFQSAAKVRDASRLSSWLHGVAFKVCAKSRQSAKRRQARERTTASPERNGSAVADSAWDRALAAVHEEVAKLPETLRVPFVLCCLEGKGVTEAAEQLGWKLGTFSGRLTRAKDAVIAKLDARGLTVGAAAGLGLATPPASVVAKAVAVCQTGFVVPSSVLQLTQGVIGMSVKSVKLLAVAVFVSCGLGLCMTKSWVATADAQGVPKKAKANPEDEIKRLQAELDAAQRAAEVAKQRDIAKQLVEMLAQQQDEAYGRTAVEAIEALAAQRGKPEQASAKTSKWEYDFVLVSEMGMSEFVKFLQDRENRGWEYNGLTKYRHDGKLADIWVFRRPAKGAAPGYGTSEYGRYLRDFYRKAADTEEAKGAESALEAYRKAVEVKPPATRVERAKEMVGRADEAKVIEAQIAQLQARLAELNKTKLIERAVFPAKDLPLEAHQLAEVLFKLAAKNLKGPKGTFTHEKGDLIIEGDKELIHWVAGMIKKLNEK
jgi:RNA polymerase sigma factor (sigma-70 family)